MDSNEQRALDLYKRAVDSFEFAAVAVAEGNSLMALGLAEAGLSFINEALPLVQSPKGRGILTESQAFWTLEILRLEEALDLKP